MLEEAQQLVNLQTVDLEVRRVEGKKAKSPEKLNHREKSAKEKEDELAALEEQQTALKRERKDRETELEDEIARLKKSQNKLMSVKTNREYQTLLKEIEEIKKANRKREDEMLARMEDIERLGKEIETKKEELGSIQEEIIAEKVHLDELVSGLDRELAKLDEKRREVAKNIPEDLLKRYDFLRSKRNGLAVVGVEDAVCLGCHMNIPPQLYNELLREEKLKVCPSCQRIIYTRSAASEQNGNA